MRVRPGALRALSSFVAAALVATSGVLGGIAGAASARPQHETPRPKVKNVIVMISDGAGYNQFLAADYFQNGQGGSQRFEKFPVAVGMSHFAEGGSYDPSLAWSDFDYVKQNPTDSAAAATAMSTGKKTWNAAIGMIGSETTPTAVEHVAERAEKLGKSTGVVTTVEWSHATPAGF
ncbi:MAG: alkaline phosphatase, partial [Coriobacteriales bacterium]|nr:alkaline phosphatase [Coriobacteriales bacterium]